MPDCTMMRLCPFYHGEMLREPAKGDRYRARYCNDNFAWCARYMVARVRGMEGVPSDLTPDETVRARTLMIDGGSAAG